MTARLEFFFEFASTYSYPAAMRIESAATARGVEVDWRPFMLGPIAKAQLGVTDSIFNQMPLKGQYMWRDVKRICDKLDLPFQRPDVFPQNGLRAARIALALLEAGAPAAVAFIKAVYLANFRDNASISDKDVLARLVAEAGADVDAALAAAGSQAAKDALRANTDLAVARGVFGAPMFFTPDGEMFWGNDRLEDALDWTVALAPA
ncbi:MAG: 2-hydroxychromene-2-carboxylate isomerase [Pseudomonadota bacterium]